MSPQQIIQDVSSRFKLALSHFDEELKKIRTGRAHPNMLDGIVVEAYGTTMPLISAGTISVPEAQLIQITPFDPNNLQAISNAIRDNKSLGLNPMDDGRVVRVPIPPLTEERRRDYVKLVGAKLEECMISLRNARHEALANIDKLKKDKTIGEDEAVRLQKQVDEIMNENKVVAEKNSKSKEQEIMTV